MADATEVVSSVVGTVLAAAVPLVATRLQGRRDARIRASIRSNVDLIEYVTKANPDDPAADWLRAHVKSQILALIQNEQGYAQRRREWGTVFFGVFFALPLAVPLFFLWRPEHWWSWTIFVILAAVMVTLLVVGIGAGLWPTKKPAEAPAEIKPSAPSAVGVPEQPAAPEQVDPLDKA